MKGQKIHALLVISPLGRPSKVLASWNVFDANRNLSR